MLALKSETCQELYSNDFDKIKVDGFTNHDAWFLVTNYGKQTETILETYAELKDADIYVRMAKAELHFGIAYEMVQNPRISLFAELVVCILILIVFGILWILY